MQLIHFSTNAQHVLDSISKHQMLMQKVDAKIPSTLVLVLQTSAVNMQWLTVQLKLLMLLSTDVLIPLMIPPQRNALSLLELVSL
jgi:hypothetical protein